ncbi:hypothetical protein A3A21_00245 [Candidatus Jorgensenbacteria bacterium RIFCSPLOWO2_01_FULL_45_25b]|uniref:M23ase beta-sheet core domain-containing protein n=1 Tax=Candidatus Jorgensenbacteria bacterium RIFCSPLOWO2_01_FULL_45_25b TaxID=1798471 RepID=A0A1F6BSA3_9BACT|nr:MAG: hypothetical protein A3A21_00245 [Candidatus Jorgensenbacteria bacterium RIFCSPLOWO2_01_FULL_45_25b]
MGISNLKKQKAFAMLLAFGIVSILVKQAPSNIARAEEIPVSPLAVSSTIALTEPSSTLPMDSSSTLQTISDDAIEGFLFRIPEDVQDKVRALNPNPSEDIYIPILFNIKPNETENSWNHKRQNGRVHKGIDIIAPRGAFIISPTDAVITNIGYDNRGGNFVLTANPGGEQFYYAHLDEVAPNIIAGQTLSRGDVIGYVGNTGNARWTLPHLHLGIYYTGIATNPYPRLTKEFSLEERIEILSRIIDKSDTAFSVAIHVISEYPEFIKEAQTTKQTLPKIITWLLENEDILAKARLIDTNIKAKEQNESVRLLQEILIKESAGPVALALAKAGSTGYFGTLTQNALAEYQASVDIFPAQGYFGPVTKTHMLSLLSREVVPSEIISQHSQKTNETLSLASINIDLKIGSEGSAVQLLQRYLIKKNTGPVALALAKAGSTGYFGTLTQNALAEYQASLGIVPAKGYFGSITRASLK